MNINAKNYQYKDVVFAEYEENQTEDESILYFESLDIIVVMNKSALCIWNYIVFQQKKGCGGTDIFIADLVDVIKNNFNIDAGIESDIYSDIIEIIAAFFERGILTCKI